MEQLDIIITIDKNSIIIITFFIIEIMLLLYYYLYFVGADFVGSSTFVKGILPNTET